MFPNQVHPAWSAIQPRLPSEDLFKELCWMGVWPRGPNRRDIGSNVCRSCHRSTSSVITDTECAGNVTVKVRPTSICLSDTRTESGWLKSFEVVRLSLFSVSTRACLETELPASDTFVAIAFAGSVFAALLKICLPSPERLTTASRVGTDFPSRVESNAGPSSALNNRSSPRWEA